MLNRSCRTCQANGNAPENNLRPPYNGNGNGNGSAAKLCKDKLLQLQKIDFSMVDTILYLDAYPDSQEALAYYHKLHAQRKALLEQMNAEGCAAVCNMDHASQTAWSWVDSPWPWETDAN